MLFDLTYGSGQSKRLCQCTAAMTGAPACRLAHVCAYLCAAHKHACAWRAPFEAAP